VLQRANSLVLVAKHGGVVDSHATSNPVISDVKKGEKNGLKLRVSLCLGLITLQIFWKI